MFYFMFDDLSLAYLFQQLLDYITEKEMTVGNLYDHLISYSANMTSMEKSDLDNNYTFLHFFDYLKNKK